MNAMCGRGMAGRPGLDFRAQKSWNFFFRHLMTVSGLTMPSASSQPANWSFRTDQNSLSSGSMCGRGFLR